MVVLDCCYPRGTLPHSNPELRSIDGDVHVLDRSLAFARHAGRDFDATRLRPGAAQWHFQGQSGFFGCWAGSVWLDRLGGYLHDRLRGLSLLSMRGMGLKHIGPMAHGPCLAKRTKAESNQAELALGFFNSMVLRWAD